MRNYAYFIGSCANVNLHCLPHSSYCGNNTSTQFFAASVAEELLLNTELTEESKDRAIHLLKEFGLYEYRDAHPSTLSGGQKQRLAHTADAVVAQLHAVVVEGRPHPPG